MSSFLKLSSARIKKLLDQFLRVADVRCTGLHKSRQEHLRLIRSMTKKDRLAKLDKTALQALLGTMWSFRFWRNSDYILENALKRGLPKVRDHLYDLLYGSDGVIDRYDRTLDSPLRFGTAAVSELLSITDPQSYAVRNISSRKGLFRLRAVELPLVTQGQISGAQYLAFCEEMGRIRKQLNEMEPIFKSLYDVDFFLYFAAYEAKEERETLAKVFAEEEDRRMGGSPADVRLALLELGSRMGLGVRAGGRDLKNLRRRKRFKMLANLTDEIPERYGEPTNRLLAEVDVLWITGKKVAAAFEVDTGKDFAEGLLLLADLVSDKKSLGITFYIVASDERREGVFAEITRPAFQNLPQPLSECCRFLPASALEMILTKLSDTVARMTPGSLKKFSESVE